MLRKTVLKNRRTVLFVQTDTLCAYAHMPKPV